MGGTECKRETGPGGNQRGQSPVEYRGNLYICPSICTSISTYIYPPQATAARGWSSPPRGWLKALRSWLRLFLGRLRPFRGWLKLFRSWPRPLRACQSIFVAGQGSGSLSKASVFYRTLSPLVSSRASLSLALSVPPMLSCTSALYIGSSKKSYLKGI